MTFTEDAAFALADRAGEALSRLRALAAHPIIPIADEAERTRLSALCAELFEEGSLAREGYRMAMRGLLGAHCRRRRPARGKPRAHRQRDVAAGRRDGRAIARAGR